MESEAQFEWVGIEVRTKPFDDKLVEPQYSLAFVIPGCHVLGLSGPAVRPAFPYASTSPNQITLLHRTLHSRHKARDIRSLLQHGHGHSPGDSRS